MFGLFGKPKDGLTKEERVIIERRDDRFAEAQTVLAEGMSASDGSQMAAGVRLMEALLKEYPDFSKPYVRLIQFSLRARKLELAKEICDLANLKFPDDPEIQGDLAKWYKFIEDH